MQKDFKDDEDNSLIIAHQEGIFNSVTKLGKNLKSVEITMSSSVKRILKLTETINGGIYRCKNLVELKLHNFVTSAELRTLIDNN